MGYETSVSGQIEITPPINWGELRRANWPVDDRYARNIRLVIEETEVETDEGTMIRRAATAIAPMQLDEPYKAYEIDDHVNEVVAVFGKDRTFTGYLEGAGEETGDMWRLYVRDGAAERVRPQIVWPDEND